MSSNTIQFIEYKVINFTYFPDGKIYMESEEDLNDVFHYQIIQQQIRTLLLSICFWVDLGYWYSTEEGLLKIFINTYSNVLCFVFKHWKLLLQKVLPNLVEKHQKSMSLQLLTFRYKK